MKSIMRRERKCGLFGFIALMFFVAVMAGCSEDSTSVIDEPIDPNDPEQVEKVLSNISTSWGSTKSDIQNHMDGYTMLVDDANLLKYTNGKGSFYVSYEFLDDALRTSLVLIPQSDATDENTDIPLSLDNYSYLGETGGASVYTAESQNTMAVVLNRDVEGESYMAYGFTPIESALYENIDPIVVQSSDPSSVGTTSLTLNAAFSGIETVESAYFYYSTTDATLKDNSKKTATVDGTSFSASISSLSPNSTVYYQPAVKVDGLEYVGTISSMELETVKTYSVGDAYPDEANAIGVVWKISDEGMSGTIISLVEETGMQWDVNGIFCIDYDCNNSYDGSKNNMGSTQPFAKWVKSLGDGWYGPAYKELSISKSNLALVNSTLSRLGYDDMNGFYWSSTEKSGDYNQAWVTTVSETSFMGYSNGFTFTNSKNQKHSVRAMKKF